MLTESDPTQWDHAEMICKSSEVAYLVFESSSGDSIVDSGTSMTLFKSILLLIDYVQQRKLRQQQAALNSRFLF